MWVLGRIRSREGVELLYSCMWLIINQWRCSSCNLFFVVIGRAGFGISSWTNETRNFNARCSHIRINGGSRHLCLHMVQDDLCMCSRVEAWLLDLEAISRKKHSKQDTLWTARYSISSTCLDSQTFLARFQNGNYTFLISVTIMPIWLRVISTNKCPKRYMLYEDANYVAQKSHERIRWMWTNLLEFFDSS